MRFLVALGALLLATTGAQAQGPYTSSAEGYWTRTGCPTGTIPCFVFYDTSGSGIPSAPAIYTALGYCQLSITTGAAVAMSTCSGGIPTGSRYAFVTPETTNVRWRDDSVDPTTSVGYPLYASSQLQYSGTSLSALKIIATTATTTVDVAFYK